VRAGARLITQQLFQPQVADVEEKGALGTEDVSVIHHADRRRRAVPVDGSPNRG